MLNAKQAKEQTETNKIQNYKADIEKSIKRAISKGCDVVYISGSIPNDVLQEYRELEFKVEIQKGRIKISWE